MSPTILVVDDEEPMRNMLMRGLKTFGYRGVLAASADAALAVVAQQAVDLVITDLRMPTAGRQNPEV